MISLTILHLILKTIIKIDQGLDVSDNVAQARSTAKYTAEFLQAVNGVWFLDMLKQILIETEQTKILLGK